MENPITGDDWQAEGPVLALSLGTSPEKTVSLLWDGLLGLPKDLDAAVIGTLEMVCSSSQLAKRRLLQGLPHQVASRLECSIS
jgi:hypothetical protein